MSKVEGLKVEGWKRGVGATGREARAGETEIVPPGELSCRASGGGTSSVWSVNVVTRRKAVRLDCWGYGFREKENEDEKEWRRNGVGFASKAPTGARGVG